MLAFAGNSGKPGSMGMPGFGRTACRSFADWAVSDNDDRNLSASALLIGIEMLGRRGDPAGEFDKDDKKLIGGSAWSRAVW